LCASVSAVGIELKEFQVKAAFLFNFTQFVDWSKEDFATPSQPIAICVLGDDPFGAALDDIVRGERVDNRGLVVRRLQRAQDSAGCQLLYVGATEKLDVTLAAVPHHGVLTVGEGRDFAERGGMIAFVTEDKRVHLRVNVGAALRAGLTISSKLLRVAELVGDDGAKK
jgi:hypothetical protein